LSAVATQAKLWYWQRLSAMVMAVFVTIHIGTIIYAVRGGLSGAEILARTQGNWFVGIFYAAFVLAAAVHAPIGLARIAEEWFGWSGTLANALALLFALTLAVLGLRAVYAVVAA
jgi:fumarate reductase subunit C